MLNRDINGGPLIKIIPACFDRSIDRSNEKHWPNRCGQTTGKICPLSLQTFCTGRRYTSGAALVGERLAKETRDFALACSMKNRHGVSSSRRSILSWRSISTEVDLIADSPTSLHDDAITERIVIYTPLLYSPPCNNEGRFYLIWQETFLSFFLQSRFPDVFKVRKKKLIHRDSTEYQTKCIDCERVLKAFFWGREKWFSRDILWPFKLFIVNLEKDTGVL